MAIDYYAINTQAIDQMLAVKKHVSTINVKTKSLVELRVSQINGCAYCVDLHANEARQLGVLQQALDCLTVWEESDLFSASESRALMWAETVTNISTVHSVERRLTSLLEQYTEEEVVDLTVIIALMNCMNRMAISFGSKPPVRSE